MKEDIRIVLQRFRKYLLNDELIEMILLKYEFAQFVILLFKVRKNDF